MNIRMTIGSMLAALMVLGGPLKGESPTNTLIISGGDRPGYWLQDKNGDVTGIRPQGRRSGRRLALMKMWQIADYLDLSDEQVDKLFPILRANQKEGDEHREKRQALYKAYSEAGEKFVGSGILTAQTWRNILLDEGLISQEIFETESQGQPHPRRSGGIPPLCRPR